MRRSYSWKVNSPDAAEYEEVCQTQLEPDNIMFREIQSDILTNTTVSENYLRVVRGKVDLQY